MFDYWAYDFNVGNILINFLIALVIALVSGKFHEVIHYVVARRLGYKVNSFSLWKNEVDVAIEPTDPNYKKIAVAPYLFFYPFGTVMLLLGIYLFPSDLFLGFLVAGIAILFLHTLSFFYEGKDVKRKVSDVQEKTSESVVSEK